MFLSCAVAVSVPFLTNQSLGGGRDLGGLGGGNADEVPMGGVFYFVSGEVTVFCFWYYEPIDEDKSMNLFW